MFPLVFVYLGANAHISFGLLHSDLELLKPLRTVAIHELIQLLELREHRTRRRSYHEQRLVLQNGRPALLAVSKQVEVVAILYVHGFSRHQPHLLANNRNSLWAEHLGHVGAVQLLVHSLHVFAINTSS